MTTPVVTWVSVPTAALGGMKGLGEQMAWLREQITWWHDRIDLSAVVRRGLRIGVAASAGFTLLELLIVLAVLGILAGIVVFSLEGVGSSAAVAACQSDFATTTEAVSVYQAQMASYPGGPDRPGSPIRMWALRLVSRPEQHRTE